MMFGFLGLTFSHAGALPGAGAVDQPPVVIFALSLFDLAEFRNLLIL